MNYGCVGIEDAIPTSLKRVVNASSPPGADPIIFQ